MDDISSAFNDSNFTYDTIFYNTIQTFIVMATGDIIIMTKRYAVARGFLARFFTPIMHHVLSLIFVHIFFYLHDLNLNAELIA